MTDMLTPAERSALMARIRSHGTAIEVRLYALVREILGSRWRIDRNDHSLPGAPDVVVPSLRLVLLADGCFYHSCPLHGRPPKSNLDYWVPKLARNVRRDAANRRALRKLGFSVWRFWEHDLTGRALERTARLLRGRLAKHREKTTGGRHRARRGRSIPR